MGGLERTDSLRRLRRKQLSRTPLCQVMLVIFHNASTLHHGTR
jgi:hypothetical protein